MDCVPLRKLETSLPRVEAALAPTHADPITRARAVLERLEARPEVTLLVALDEWVNAAEAMLDRLEAGAQDNG